MGFAPSFPLLPDPLKSNKLKGVFPYLLLSPTFCERLSNSSETHQFKILKNKNNGTMVS
jgi:hypothetical protein